MMRLEVKKTAEAMDQLPTLHSFQGISLETVSRSVLRSELVLEAHPLIFQIPGCVCQDIFMVWPKPQ